MELFDCWTSPLRRYFRLKWAHQNCTAGAKDPEVTKRLLNGAEKGYYLIDGEKKGGGPHDQNNNVTLTLTAMAASISSDRSKMDIARTPTASRATRRSAVDSDYLRKSLLQGISEERG